MKRSSRVHLLLMGSTSVALAGCGDDPEPMGVFTNVAECVESGAYTPEQCSAALEQAKQEHPKIAPKYATKDDCEADFGQGKCETPASGGGRSQGPSSGESSGSFWMPLMMGYLAGNVLGNLKNGFGQPLYQPNVGRPRDNDRRSWGGGYTYSPGSWRTAANTEIAQRTGLGRVDRGTLRSSLPTTTTIARGGFGARAASVGTGGG
ncbi:MAG: hypothetical protein FD149_2570 [Rhodospirillaceae bacterium]|nr:MAG: hypothetical protein FD149_2570 [Rhodospirillaceae bacterium]